MIYFDNAATSFPKAPGVTEAITRFVTESAANPGRAGHRLSVAAEKMLDDIRLKLTRLFDGDDHHRMIFAMNTTDALNMAIKGVLHFDQHRPQGQLPHVITTVLEHNSVSRPLVALRDQRTIELTQVDCDERGWVDPQSIKAAIQPHTKMIVITHASNVLGTIQPIADIGALARAHDLLFCVDAAQTAGAIDISIKKMHIDLLAFPGHKSLLGPTGTGGLYVGTRCPQPTQGLTAWREGGTGGDSSTPTMPAIYPYFLEGGTPNTVGLSGLSASLDYVITHGAHKHLAHEQAMVRTLLERWSHDHRLTIYGPRDAAQQVGALSINIKNMEPQDVGTILDDSFQIAVRPGLHCSPYIHRRLGTHPSGTVRISPGVFNTMDELNTLITAVEQIADSAN